jgi:hypothetical protein
MLGLSWMPSYKILFFQRTQNLKSSQQRTQNTTKHPNSLAIFKQQS